MFAIAQTGDTRVSNIGDQKRRDAVTPLADVHIRIYTYVLPTDFSPIVTFLLKNSSCIPLQCVLKKRHFACKWRMEM